MSIVLLTACTASTGAEGQSGTSAESATPAPQSVPAGPQDSAVNCPAGLLDALAKFKGPSYSLSIAPLSAVQPKELQPLLGDACVIAYTKAGLYFTWDFSATATLPAIGDAARSAGYSGDPDTPDGGVINYTKGTDLVDAFTIEPTAPLAEFFPSGVLVQTTSDTAP